MVVNKGGKCERKRNSVNSCIIVQLLNYSLCLSFCLSWVFHLQEKLPSWLCFLSHAFHHNLMRSTHTRRYTSHHSVHRKELQHGLR